MLNLPHCVDGCRIDLLNFHIVVERKLSSEILKSCKDHREKVFAKTFVCIHFLGV